ncbi:MAG: YDG domain-containing protein, partial [Verrucomicrobia bacterium]|nr:YDG domain-containing protein [Verrucomicrobiota bacterium]
TKDYDGTTSAAANPTITAGAIQTGDSAPVWTETYDNSNPGTGKTMTPAALKVTDGNTGLNYSYTYTPVSTGVINLLEISQQPTNTGVCSESPAVFTVVVPPAEGLTYQWQVSADGGVTFTNISVTATNASYTNEFTPLSDNGNLYQVIVAEGTGSVTSAPPAVLTTGAPVTADSGGNQTVCAGSPTAGLGGTVGGGATGGTWTSPGAGIFTPDATTLNATYTPSVAEVADINHHGPESVLQSSRDANDCNHPCRAGDYRAAGQRDCLRGHARGLLRDRDRRGRDVSVAGERRLRHHLHEPHHRRDLCELHEPRAFIRR